ncbi:ATP-binding cassette domain-containing protein, partial [bacterium]|nr:ATP-binding cassette domain-containing protein [bacterium]
LVYRHPGSRESIPAALNDISFTIAGGEFVALVGANGSGKTTLARHLNALVTPTSGDVLIDGKNTRDVTSHPQIRADVGMVFQHPEDQIVATIVEEDVAFGPENLCRLPKVIREEVDQALEIVNMNEQRRRQPHLLSAGQMQRVALAGVLAMQPQCIIFDETTAMLDPAGRRDVLHRMADLNRMGITVIFITHFMEEVILGRRALLLDKGRLTFDGSPQALFADAELITRSGLEQPAATRFYYKFPFLFPGVKSATADFNQLLESIPTYDGKVKNSAGHVLSANTESNEIEIRDLSHVYLEGTPLAQQSLVSVSMDVKKNIPHGLVGATGSGKSTLLQHLNGLYRPQHGQMRVGSFDLAAPDLDVMALRRYAGLVFQNPELYFFEQYVGDEIAFGPKKMGNPDLRERVKWAMEVVGLDFAEFKDRITGTLSGGEMRKVALASALAMKPALLVLDEPTAGLDPRSRRSLLGNLQQLQGEGVQVLFSSHNMDDIAEMVQTLTVLSKGKSLVTLPVHEAFTDRE